VTITTRDLKNDAGHVIALPLVKIQILGEVFHLLLEARDGGGGLLFFLLSSLSETCTGSGISPPFLIGNTRCRLHIHRQLNRP
jgi:hypothetical protein